jgi:hypothetical protein
MNKLNKLHVILICIFATVQVASAQTPQAFKYQTVARDNIGNILANQNISFRMSVLQGELPGTVVFSETHLATTNSTGLATFEIGRGAVVSGNFATIDWSISPCFLKTEIDPAGGMAFIEMGTSELLSVPYALHAKNAETGGTPYTAGTGIDITGSTVTNISPNALHTGDATGSNALTVVKIQGKAVSAAAPASSQALVWNGVEWAPSTLTGNGTPGWSLTGNSGTNPAVNFVGTTDNKPLTFKMNNQLAGKFEQTNTALGVNAMYSNTTGIFNIAIGNGALYSNTIRSNLVAIGDSALNHNNATTGVMAGKNNTAVGSKALFANTTGHSNTANGFQALLSTTIGYGNTAYGVQTLFSNTNGYYNTAVGLQSLFLNTTGFQNTANGAQSLLDNTTGIGNTAQGSQSLYSNNTGNFNVATGWRALYLNSSGFSNVAVGASALFNNTNVSNLVAVGDSALYDNTTGAANTAVGSKALFSNTTGSWNLASGFNALKSNTTGYGNTACGESAMLINTTGYHNTATGTSALRSNTTGTLNTANGVVALYANVDGFSNAAFGAYALSSNTAGYRNTASGTKTLEHNSTGIDNTAFGMESLNTNTTGSSNTAAGKNALYSNSTGEGNTANGVAALFANTTGIFNTASGLMALNNNTTGYNNTAFGKDALLFNSTGNSNVGIGYRAGYWETESNRLYIDNTSHGNLSDARSKALIYGEFNADPGYQKLVINANVGIGTTNPTYKLTVNGGIRAKEVVVNTGWSDFVFDEDYSLMPLHKLEKYIVNNKHLPEIPGAGEVEENGISLGNMDAKLLQKIEELTLYLIELNHKVENLESENQSLKTQISSFIK